MTIIGKSKAAFAMICDIINSQKIFFGKVQIYNNLDLPEEFKYPNLTVSETKLLNDFRYAIGAVMPETKRKLVELFGAKIKTCEALIHKTAFISIINYPEGCLIDSNVSVAYGAVLGRFVTLYANSSIAHDAVIGDFVTVCPNSAICGNVKIGEGTFIGAGSVIKNEVIIGKNCVIGAGSVVLENVPDGETVYGNPAKVKSNHLVY